MALDNNEKTGLFVFSAVLIVYFFFVKEKIKAPGAKAEASGTASIDGFSDDVKTRPTLKTPSMDPQQLRKCSKGVQDAYNCMKAYVAAYNAKEPQTELNQLVKDMKRRYSVTVYIKPDGRAAVCDRTGKDILINDL